MPCSSTSTLGVLSPDILPIISSHLPLYAQTSSLLALALTSHRLKEITIPRLLYQRVWLQGEKSALGVLSMLKTQAGAMGEHNLREGDEIPLGQHIRRLCVASELSKEARETNVDVVRQLHALIDAGGLPNLVSLVLHMARGWYMDEDDGYKEIMGFGRLDQSFWSSLKKECPRVTEISLTGASEWPDDPWLEDGLLKYQVRYCVWTNIKLLISNLQQLKVFRLEYSRSGADLEGGHKPS